MLGRHITLSAIIHELMASLYLRFAAMIMVTVMALAATNDKTAPDPLPVCAQVDSIGIDGMAPMAVQPRAPPVI